MNSCIIGSADIADPAILADLDRVSLLPRTSEYSEFVRGNWCTFVLRNHTGDCRDKELVDYSGKALGTELDGQLRAIHDLIERTFVVSRVKWVRLFLFFGEGMLLPHRDFLELEKPFKRVHLPLQTNDAALHSEESHVFHMREGEIWFLDTGSVHSACNRSPTVRATIVLDFPGECDFDEILQPAAQKHVVPPCLLTRPGLTDDDQKSIADWTSRIDVQTFAECLWDLAGVHFDRNVSSVLAYEWLKGICEGSGSPGLLQRAEAARNFFIGDRGPGEKFSLRGSAS